MKKSGKITLPSKSVICDFKILMLEMVERLAEGTVLSKKRVIVTYFGTPVIVIAKLWELIQDRNKDESEEVRKPWKIKNIFCRLCTA